MVLCCVKVIVAVSRLLQVLLRESSPSRVMGKHSLFVIYSPMFLGGFGFAGVFCTVKSAPKSLLKLVEFQSAFNCVC